MNDPLEIAQLIVRGEYINFNFKNVFEAASAIYRFSNEDISSYFHHLKNKKNVLTVIGSGGQILNGILAGTLNFDAFDISIFPEYYLHLQIASIIALSKEEYLKYYFSEDKTELFCDELYEKISLNLGGKYKEFWDTLYMFDDGIDIYNSLLFRHDVCLKDFVVNSNPYLQDDNYEKLKNKLCSEPIKINTFISDITKTRFKGQYDLVNLSNILSYYYGENTLHELIHFLKTNFSLNENGEIINYFYDLNPETIKRMEQLLDNGYVENISKKKLLVYKQKNNM